MLGKHLRLQAAILAARLVKSVAPRETRRAFNDCLDALAIYKKHLAAVRRSHDLQRAHEPLRLEIGGGPHCKSGWINIDLRARDGLTLDLRRPLPFADASAAEIYLEHVLEGLSYPEEPMRLLGECYRVLRAGGNFTAGIADAARAFRAYAAGTGAFYRDKYWANVRPDFVRCPMDELNWLIYMGKSNHHMFDEQILRMRLEEAGFVDVRRRDQDPTQDSPWRKHQTIYLQARKPEHPDVAADKMRMRHMRELMDVMAADAALARSVAGLAPAERYALLRLAMLISGGWGNTLVAGASTLPLVPILASFSTFRGTEIVGVTHADDAAAATAPSAREGVKRCRYPPFPFADGHFRIVATVLSGKDLRSCHDILRDIGRLLAPDKHARAYVVTAGDFRLEPVPALVALYSESLPAGAGNLSVLKHATAR